MQQLEEVNEKRPVSTNKHILNQLTCYPQISSLVLQAANTHIFGFKLTTLIQPLLGVMEAQVLSRGLAGLPLRVHCPRDYRHALQGLPGGHPERPQGEGLACRVHRT